jgi:hypothetical protein
MFDDVVCDVHVHTTVAWIYVCCSSDLWWCSRSVHVMFCDVFCDVRIVYTWCSMAIAWRKIYISGTWNNFNFSILQSPEFCVCCSGDILWWILRCSRSIYVMFYDVFYDIHVHTTVTWICVCCLGDVCWWLCSVHVMFYIHHDFSYSCRTCH